MKPPSLKALQTRCENWNKVFPVGTPVNYHSVIGESKHISTKTRSEAFILSGHTAVVFVENVSGCVALDALTSPSAAPVRISSDIVLPVPPAADLDVKEDA